jgi:glutamine synthetase
MMRGSELFTGAALDGLGQGPNDDELAVHPEPNAVSILPWRTDVAWAPGNLYYHGQSWEMCSRTALAEQVKRAAAMGLKFNLGIECEIYLVRREGEGIVPANPRDTIPKAAYDTVLLLEHLEWLDEVVSAMDRLGWHTHSFDHEDANCQFEFDFAYADVMTMADRFVLWRLMTKEIARKHGWEATFMAKPFADRTGSGAHFNMSLADEKTGNNIFGDKSDTRGCGLSQLAYHFLGGVKKHASAIVATTCPTVNSYKRLVKTGSVTGFTWAPVFISYGGNNRTHMLRVPLLRPEVEGSEAAHDGGVYLSDARVECRAVDPSMNPYLAAAMMLAAGLEGIQKEIDPGDPINVNMYEQSQKDLDRLGVKQLPRTLLEAVDAFAADPIGQEALGEPLWKSFIDIKTQEWWRYHNSISNWEIDYYLTKY